MPRHDVIRARDLKVSKMVQRSFDNVRAVRPVPKSLIERALWPGPTTRRHSDGQDIDGIWRHCTLHNCKDLLPHIGLELGNPTVTFVDPDGSSRTMRDGSWMK